jgi:hypothetical protein
MIRLAGGLIALALAPAFRGKALAKKEEGSAA